MIEWLKSIIAMYQNIGDDRESYELYEFEAWAIAEYDGDASPWRSVEDGLPEEGQAIAVRYNLGCISAFWYGVEGMLAKNVTHWMPLPPLAQEQQP